MQTSRVMFWFLLLILNLIAGISCTCTERSFDEASVIVCANTKGCRQQQNVKGCVNSMAFVDDVGEVYLNSNVRKFRRGAFINMPHLKGIYATNISAEIIYPGAFTNLPVLEVIDLSYNKIEDIILGVFNDMNLESLDLGSNSISYIDRGAFSNMPYLRIMLLNKNSLPEFNKQWFINTTSVEILDLSYNNISTIPQWSFDSLPELVHVDLSFNKIMEIGLAAFSNIKQLNFLDLTQNNLTEINPNIFHKGITVKELRFPLNSLSSLSEELFTKQKIYAVSLYPNPWRCPDLKRILKWGNMYVVTILDSKKDNRIMMDSGQPICSCPTQTSPLECAL